MERSHAGVPRCRNTYGLRLRVRMHMTVMVMMGARALKCESQTCPRCDLL